MIVQGYTVPPEVEAALVARMRVGVFTRRQIAQVAWDAGVTNGLAEMVAGRVIQKESRAGHIRYWSSGRSL